MKTYWDLPEQERANLSQDDVQRYVDAELMCKGVLKATAPACEPVPVVPVPATSVFVVRHPSPYGRTDLGVAFHTSDAAKAFIALRPLVVQSEYLEGTSVSYTRALDDSEIAEVPILTEGVKNATKADLKRAASIKAANERASTAYAAALRAQDDALKGLWEDWSACRDKAAELRSVGSTYADYLRTTEGDATMAEKFLAKVYDESVVAEAVAWGLLNTQRTAA